MKVVDYLQAKYGSGKTTTLLACEAAVFGIPYPLRSGWLKQHGGVEVTPDVARRLERALKASKAETAKDGLAVLQAAWIELKRLPDANSAAFLESKAWKRLRLQALNLHGRRCQICGSSAKTGDVLNVDHVLPRRLFPDLALRLDNLQVLCGVCNEGKGNWDMTDARTQGEPSPGS
jgi:5-methylcytosine-specific restriction endonuclease McrA